MNKKTKDIIVVGLALFAMFLGAGNIVFPPFLGYNAGTSWGLGTLGFILTGTCLPMLGVLAVNKAGGKATDISDKVNPKFSTLLNTVIIIFIGPLFAIPRTAATTVQLSFVPFLPDTFGLKSILIIGSLLFFAICLYFVLSPSNVIDRIGSMLTPVLSIFLLTIIAISIFKPADSPQAPIQDNVFAFGFTSGYQTMDALASIIFAGTIIETVRAKGYSNKETYGIMKKVVLISGFGTGIVYVGFCRIGAIGSKYFVNVDDRAALTVEAIDKLAGLFGRMLLAGIIFLACLTTAIGLLLTASKYFEEKLKGKYSYRQIAVTMTILSYAISIMGVEGIINFASPLLDLIYPVVITLIILNLVGKDGCQIRECYIGGVIGALVMGTVAAFSYVPALKDSLKKFMGFFPFGNDGFAAFTPALLGIVAGYIVYHLRKTGKKSSQPVS